MDPPRHVEGMRCLKCGYDLSSLAYGPCPECGRTMGGEEAAVFKRGSDLLTDAREWLLGAAVALVGVVIVYACGALMLTERPRAALDAAAAVLGVVVGSALLGVVASVTLPELDRKLFILAWLRLLWRLHVPWLVVPVTMLIALLAMGLDVWLGGEGRVAGPMVVMVWLMVWFIGLILAIVIWSHAWGCVMSRVMPMMNDWHSVLPIVFVLVSVGASAVLGLVGGLMVLSGVLRWFGFESPFD